MYNAKEEFIEDDGFECENCGKWCTFDQVVKVSDGETRCIDCHSFLEDEIRSAKQYRLDF
jgi:hypothetical protein